MSDDFKFTKTAIEWRRNTVLQRLAKGYSKADIAKELQLHPSTISLDVQWLKEQAQRELRVHIKEVIPFEYARAITGINDILRRASEMLDKTTDPKIQLQTMTLLMQLYSNIMQMATEGGIVQEAMKKVEQLQTNAPLLPSDSKVSEKGEDEESEPMEPEEDLEKGEE